MYTEGIGFWNIFQMPFLPNQCGISFLCIFNAVCAYKIVLAVGLFITSKIPVLSRCNAQMAALTKQ